MWSPNHTILELILNIYILLAKPNFNSPINNEAKNPDYEIIAREYNEKFGKKSDDYITVYIESQSKASIDIIVNRYETIGKAKEKYFGRVGSRRDNQWIYDAEILNDNKTLEYYGIEDQDRITANELSRG